MGLSVTFVSGLRRCGKSDLIAVMIERLWKAQPHYIRLARAGSGKQPPNSPPAAPLKCGVASARWLDYDADRIFEILPDALAAIHREDRYGAVVIEADTDADSNIRCVYPYDHRVFVMPLPSTSSDLFRDAAQAANELGKVLDDTATFAAEMFGLLTQSGHDDVDPSEDRIDFTPKQMRGFLYSPLGDELATRVQLLPAYHGMVESEVIVVNTRGKAPVGETEECIRRLVRMLDRIHRMSGHRTQLFLCDPAQHNDRTTKQLLKALKPMCVGGK